jgi:glycosyltransferase involved in cell wall biosynthesis
MIVKNESAVIERCLASLRDHIDAWVIVDTGSTDNTKEKIRKSLEGIPGALHERPWRNFGSNRSEAVALAYESGCDYFLFFDADDVLLTPPGFEWRARIRTHAQLRRLSLRPRFIGFKQIALALGWRAA